MDKFLPKKPCLESEQAGTFPGGTTSTPVDINAGGLVTGTADRADGSFGAFLYDSRARTPLQDLGSLGGNTIPRAVNDAGTVIGWSFVSPRLGSFDKSTTSEAIDVNAAGQVLVNALGPDGVRRGYFYDGSTLQPLADNTETAAINAGGQVVGWYAAPDPRAMLWTRAEGIVDLNTRGTSRWPDCVCRMDWRSRTTARSWRAPIRAWCC